MFFLALAYLAFFSIALPDSTLGVIWPSVRATLDQPLSAAGMIPPIGVAAGLISTTLAPYLVARLGVGRLLAAGTFVSAVSLAIDAACTQWWQFLAGVAVGGLAAGAVDTTLNVVAARSFRPRRITGLHASYGVGAAVSPLIVTAVIVSGASWRWAYGIVMVVQLVVALVFAATRRRWEAEPARPAPAGGRAAGVWSVSAVIGLVAVMLQTGIESAVAIWSYSYLTAALDVSPGVAGALASGYWVTLVVGRLGFGELAERVGPWRVMGIAVTLLLAACVLLALPWAGTGMAAVLLFGVAAAPLYPLLVLTTSQRTSPAVADRVVGLQAAASSLGSATLPAAVGLAMGWRLGAFVPALASLCVAAAVVHVLIRRRVASPPVEES